MARSDLWHFLSQFIRGQPRLWRISRWPKAAVLTFLGWFPTWRSSNYLFPPPPHHHHQPVSLMRPAGTKLPLSAYQHMYCIGDNDEADDSSARRSTSGFGEMRCLLLSTVCGNYHPGRVWEGHHPPCNPLIPQGGNSPRLGTPDLKWPNLRLVEFLKIVRPSMPFIFMYTSIQFSSTLPDVKIHRPNLPQSIFFFG